eukprot:m.115788 g.115788  ORF g.115788 m.115788 type:complete len:281 (+) comp37563_c0_seq16:1280-2122(+)
MSGTYKCQFQVPGSLKLVQRIIDVIVKGPPLAPRILKATIVTQNYYFKAFLSWTVLFDGNSQITEYQVNWEADRTDIRNVERNSHGVQGFPLNSFIHLDLDVNISLVTAVRFSVLAYNDYGSSRVSNVCRVPATDFQIVTTVTTLNSAFENTENSNLNVSVINATNATGTTSLTYFSEASKDRSVWLIIVIGVGGAAFILILSPIVLIILIRLAKQRALKHRSAAPKQETTNESTSVDGRERERTVSDAILVRFSAIPQSSIGESEELSLPPFHPNVTEV